MLTKKNGLCCKIGSRSVELYIKIEVKENGLVELRNIELDAQKGIKHEENRKLYCEWCLITFTEEDYGKSSIISRAQDRKEIVDAE